VAYFNVLSSNLPVEIERNTTINLTYDSQPAEIRTGYFSNTGPRDLFLALQYTASHCWQF
jgi:hypothetical protein